MGKFNHSNLDRFLYQQRKSKLESPKTMNESRPIPSQSRVIWAGMCPIKNQGRERGVKWDKDDGDIPRETSIKGKVEQVIGRFHTPMSITPFGKNLQGRHRCEVVTGTEEKLRRRLRIERLLLRYPSPDSRSLRKKLRNPEISSSSIVVLVSYFPGTLSR